MPDFGAFLGGFGPEILDVKFLMVVVSFAFVEFFDGSGTLMAVGKRAGITDVGGNVVLDRAMNWATHLCTQMFFDNLHFYRYMTLIRKEGIDLPVSAGVMPIVRKSQIDRTLALSNASLPQDFQALLDKWQDNPDGLYQAGIDYAIGQLRDLIEAGADGVHLYAMNNADVVIRIYEGIRDLL